MQDTDALQILNEDNPFTAVAVAAAAAANKDKPKVKLNEDVVSATTLNDLKEQTPPVVVVGGSAGFLKQRRFASGYSEP